jgi:ketosteroid isomerase-like protein
MRIAIVTVWMVAAVAAPAFADATADARAHDEAFGKACAAGDVKAVVALYADDAHVIWPGAGDEAHDKAGIEKLAAGLCTGKGPTPALDSLVAVPLDADHIAIVGHWTIPPAGGKGAKTEIRTSEVIAKTPAGWRYVVDHASIGVPPPKPTRRHAH